MTQFSVKNRKIIAMRKGVAPFGIRRVCSTCSYPASECESVSESESESESESVGVVYELVKHSWVAQIICLLATGLQGI